MARLAGVHTGSLSPAAIDRMTSARFLFASMALIAAACSVTAPVAEMPGREAEAEAFAVATDDGSYLDRIDPLGGQWRVERIEEADFTAFKGWVHFSAGGFINHGAGCSGGYPAFYRLEGESMTVTRLEPIRIGKCAGAANAQSERRLAAFLDQASGWTRQGDTLVLTTRDGSRAWLNRPSEPHPQLAGRWLIDSIGSERLVTERRPATLSIAMGGIGAHGDCNSMGGSFTIPTPGRIVVAGPFMSTAIGCAAEDQAEDDLMTRAMTSATAYRLDGDRLILSGGPGMVLRRPPPPDRHLAGEYESCGNTLLGAYHEGAITLVIDATTMRDNAACTARYSADGPNLALELDSGPACGDSAPPFEPGEPVGVGGEISTLAVTRPSGFGFTESGQLMLRTERGLLTMCRKGSPPPFGG